MVPAFMAAIAWVAVRSTCCALLSGAALSLPLEPQAVKPVVLPSTAAAETAPVLLKKCRREGEWFMTCLHNFLNSHTQGFVRGLIVGNHVIRRYPSKQGYKGGP